MATSQNWSRITWFGASEPYSIDVLGSNQPSQSPLSTIQSAEATSAASREPGLLARPGSISMKYVAGSSSGNSQ